MLSLWNLAHHSLSNNGLKLGTYCPKLITNINQKSCYLRFFLALAVKWCARLQRDNISLLYICKNSPYHEILSSTELYLHLYQLGLISMLEDFVKLCRKTFTINKMKIIDKESKGKPFKINIKKKLFKETWALETWG